MKRINHMVFSVVLLLNIFVVAAQEKNYTSLKYALFTWEKTQDNFQDYYTYLNDSETILTGKDISFLNEQYQNLGLLLDEVDTFNSKQLLTPEALFFRIKSLELFLDFAKVCKHNTKVLNVLNEQSVEYQRSKGAFYSDAECFLSENYVKELILHWNALQNSSDFNSKDFTDIKSTNFYCDFLKTDYGQKANLQIFESKVKERRQSKYLYAMHEFGDGFIDTSSRLISNFFGFFRIRTGKLYKDVDFLADVTQDIQPLDILLEKTPFRLTDKIIPGYWSHAAVYVGNEEQLKELGVWNHPLVIPHHEAIRNGACIIEALRTNVAINSFESFSNVDAYAQLRLNQELSLEKKQEILLTVFAQIGKEYDFRFNVESSDKMVCTEIHYLAYEMLKFQPRLNLGAYSVSVDDLAAQGVSNSVLKPMKLYIDGDKVTENIQETFDALINSKSENLASSY